MFTCGHKFKSPRLWQDQEKSGRHIRFTSNKRVLPCHLSQTLLPCKSQSYYQCWESNSWKIQNEKIWSCSDAALNLSNYPMIYYKKNYLTASSIANEKSLLVYWVTIKQNHLLYKHQCFIRISATEKIIYFHIQKYDIFTCKNISQSEIRKSSLNLNLLPCPLCFEQDAGHC